MKSKVTKKRIKNTEIKAVTSYSGQISSITPNLPEKINLTNDPLRLMKFNRGYVYSANHKISSALASLPYHLYTVVDSGNVAKMLTPHMVVSKDCRKAVASSAKLRLQDKQEMVEVYQHPILDLLKSPAKGWSQYEWLYVISTYLGLIGNAYLKKVVDGSGQLTGLEPLMSEYVAIRYDDTGTITDYDYRPYGSIKGQTFKASEIVHIRNRVAGSLIVGMGNLEACLQSFAVASNAENFAASLLNNNAVPAYMVICEDMQLPLGADGQVDTAKAEAIETAWHAKFGGRNRGGVKFGFGGKTKIEKLDVSMADTKIDIFMTEAKKQICAAFSVPLSTLDETDSNKATALASMKQLKVFGVFPKVALILDQLNSVFAEYFDSGLFVWIDQREAMDPDPQEQATVLSVLKNAGIMSVNEARLTLGLPSLEGEEYNKPIAANASTAVQGQAINAPIA